MIAVSGGLDAAGQAALMVAIQQVLAEEAAASAAPALAPYAYRSRWARAGRAAGALPPPPVAGDGLDWKGVAGG